MYTKFFGFKERPFQLVPNPAYLFLSKSHEEAIAHLEYAISHGDGFVEITGEVGTGKTTLCRVFLENLDDDSEVAYIFNPQLDALELLKAINDEFGISSEANNTKELIDGLNTFLMEQKSRGKKAILLIDEAQNLGMDVLEQLRLLSNLETNTSKLLQIILVGQPELQKKLDSYELRQLRQRMTLSWYLTPLNQAETREYIRHRVNSASSKTGDKFSESAYHKIFKYSAGIPRLINIACDRALLTAYGYNQRKVTGSIAGNAIRELNDRGGKKQRRLTGGRVAAVFIVVLCLAAASVWLTKNSSPPLIDKSGQKETTVKTQSPSGETRDFSSFLGNQSNRLSRRAAIKHALALWEAPPRFSPQLDEINDNQAYFQFAARHHDFNLLPVPGDLDLLKKLNLPAVMEFVLPNATAPRYLTLVAIKGDRLLLDSGTEKSTWSLGVGEFREYWSGNAYILWKDFFNCKGDIPIAAPRESVFTLKMLLRDIGYTDIELNDTYDDATGEAIREIQAGQGIEVDGIVGSQTKIVLYNLKKDLKIPHIVPGSDLPGHRDNEKQEPGN